MARLVFSRLPGQCALIQVQGDHAGSFRASDGQDHFSILDERGGSESEEGFASAKLFSAVDLPDLFAGSDVSALNQGIRPDGNNTIFLNGWGSSRTFIESKIVPIGGGDALLPDRLAGAGLKTLEEIAVILSMEKEYSISNRDRTAKALTDGASPQLAWTF